MRRGNGGNSRWMGGYEEAILHNEREVSSSDESLLLSGLATDLL